MKIQEFCGKIRQDESRLFQALRTLRRARRRKLLNNHMANWNPWNVYR